MSSRSTARTDSWSCLIERLRSDLKRTRKERDDAVAELAAVRALHAHRLDALAGPVDHGNVDRDDPAEEWESLHVGHEILPPAA